MKSGKNLERFKLEAVGEGYGAAVFGVLLGGRLLLEEHYETRLAGALLMLMGIVLIAWHHG